MAHGGAAPCPDFTKRMERSTSGVFTTNPTYHNGDKRCTPLTPESLVQSPIRKSCIHTQSRNRTSVSPSAR